MDGFSEKFTWLIHIIGIALVVAAILLAASCGDGAGDGFGTSGSSAGDDDDGGDDSWDDDDDSSGDDDFTDDDDNATPTPPPPDPEPDFDPGTRPRICDGAVFVMNSDYDFVSRIHADTLEVDTIEVGDDPITMRATDSCSALITLNSGDDSVSIVSADDLSVVDLPVRPGMNELAMAPGSEYVVAYHKFGSDTGSQGYGEVTIVDLPDQQTRSLAVGFPPDEVVFTRDDRAVLASEINLALVGLEDGSFSNIATGLDIEQEQTIRKVAVTANGNYALILAKAVEKLLALNLSTLDITDVPLGCYPTDLDVAESGDTTLVVCKQQNKIIVLNNGDLTLEEFDTDKTIGSGELASDGSLAVLFTAAETIEQVHVFKPADGSLVTYYTVKPLIGAAISPGDRSAILFHYGGDGNPIDSFDEYFDNKDAFSIMNLSDGRINPVETPTTPELVSFASDGKLAVVPMPEYRQIILAHPDTGLADTLITPSEPLEVGAIAEFGVAFALQDHPLGRISFYDADSLSVQTITGFLLNGNIE